MYDDGVGVYGRRRGELGRETGRVAVLGNGRRARREREEKEGANGGCWRGREEWKGMIARSDYVFTRSGGKSGRENSLGSAVPRTAVRLFELCMDTACLQRVLFAVRDSDS